jgi:hypothetical protein
MHTLGRLWSIEFISGQKIVNRIFTLLSKAQIYLVAGGQGRLAQCDRRPHSSFNFAGSVEPTPPSTRHRRDWQQLNAAVAMVGAVHSLEITAITTNGFPC